MANPVTKIRNTAADYRKLDGRDKRRFWTDGILNNALYILMAIFIIYTAIVNHHFLKIGSITNIISLAAASLPFALGVAGCIVLTGTDLSGGRVVGLSAALSAALLQKTDLARRMFSWMPNIPTWAGICIAILAVIAIGAIIGFVNGFFVAKFKLHPFIVTLATQLITYGLILVFFMLNDNNGQPLSGLSDGYSSFIKGKMISIGAVSLPWYVLYAIILLAITWFLWNKTTFGKNMFAVGSNAEAANVSGVNVFRTTVLVHTFAGVMYGLTGFIEGARISSITQSTGLNYECDRRRFVRRRHRQDQRHRARRSHPAYHLRCADLPCHRFQPAVHHQGPHHSGRLLSGYAQVPRQKVKTTAAPPGLLPGGVFILKVGAGHAPPVREAAIGSLIRRSAPFPTPRFPDVSLRGAKRRGNLAVPGRITERLRRIQ